MENGRMGLLDRIGKGFAWNFVFIFEILNWNDLNTFYSKGVAPKRSDCVSILDRFVARHWYQFTSALSPAIHSLVTRFVTILYLHISIWNQWVPSFVLSFFVPPISGKVRLNWMRELQLQNNNSSSEAQAKQSFFCHGVAGISRFARNLKFCPDSHFGDGKLQPRTVARG